MRQNGEGEMTDCNDCQKLRNSHDALVKALEKIRDDNYPPADLEIQDCKQPEMIWQSVARRALALLSDDQRPGQE